MPATRHSRRTLMRSMAILGGAAAVPLAGCGQETSGGPAAAPSAAATAAAGTGTSPGAGATLTPGKMSVWFSANWNTVTDEAVGSIFADWGKQNNTEVEWQSIPGSPQILANESAALAAGQPPEIDNNNGIYWYSQGERADLTALVTKVKDKAGGIPNVAVASATATDGKIFAAPYAVDPWPAHWRKDLIGKETGGRFFNTWDEVLELGPKIQQPPRNFLVAFATGHEGDHVNNLVTVLWAYGGRLSDEKGVPDIKRRGCRTSRTRPTRPGSTWWSSSGRPG
jgi:ABC-type glycerol-3-phosphate transport system substrate-binding protein